MNQRVVNSKGKDIRRDKFKKSRHEDSEKWDEESTGTGVPARSLSEKSLATYDITNRSTSRDIDKSRSKSRDGHPSLIFRRQGQDRLRGSRPSVSSTQRTLSPEGSPTRQTEHIKTEYARNRSNVTRPTTKTDSVYIDGINKRNDALPSGGSEETRLQRLLQRLDRETDRERLLMALRHLRELLLTCDSSSTMTKTLSGSLTSVTNTFQNILTHRLHGDMKREVSYCLSHLPPLLGSETKNFLQWLFDFYFTSATDEARILLLNVLLQCLKDDKDSKKMNQFMPMIMDQLQSALEIADMPELLVGLMDVISLVANIAPAVFTQHFRDTVDILVGWHIDSSQSLGHLTYTSRALIGFRPFWVADISFSLTLLGQFLEDVEAYAQDLSHSPSGAEEEEEEEEIPSTQECLAKITSLFRVFLTVLKCLGGQASPNQSSSVTWEFLTESLKCLLRCLIVTVSVEIKEDLLTVGNECLCLLLSQCGAHSIAACDPLLKYLGQLIHPPGLQGTPQETFLVSLLKLMGHVAKELAGQLPTEFVSLVFGPSSVAQQLKHWPYRQAQQQLLCLQQAIFGLKNVPVLEEAYRCLLGELQRSHSVLLGDPLQLLPVSTGSVDIPDPVPSLPDIMSDDGPEERLKAAREAQASVLSCLAALAEIGNAKHSIIGMWALKPSFFDLASQRLQPCSPVLASRHPAVHYAVLYTLYSHCSRHGHFVSSSVLLSQFNIGSSSPLLASVPSPPSSGHLTALLSLLANLFEQAEACTDVRLLCITWSQEILETLQQHTSRLCQSKEFLCFARGLLETCFSPMPSLSKTGCIAVQTLVRNAAVALPQKLLRRCYEVCVIHLGAANTSLREAFQDLFSLLPFNIALSCLPLSYGVDCNQNNNNNNHNNSSNSSGSHSGLHGGWLARHHFLSKSSTAHFSPQTFRKVMAYILKGIKPKNSEWEERTFSICQQSDRQSRVERMLGQEVRISEGAFWFWAVWQAAQHCVLLKLRTGLGKPQDTFTTIEGALKHYALNHGEDNNWNSLKGNVFDSTLQVKLLLDFTEQLEKLMYNAFEGCATALPSAPKNVRSFFRTNKNTCLEWLSRIRLAALKVAIKAGHYTAAVRYAYVFLQEKGSSDTCEASELESVLILLAQALTALHCPEALLGLHVWFREKTRRKCHWMKPVADQAAGRYEASVAEYISQLQQWESNDQVLASIGLMPGSKNSTSPQNSEEHPEFFKDQDTKILQSLQKLDLQDGPILKFPEEQTFLFSQLVECYINLGNWNKASEWLKQFNKLLSHQRASNGIRTSSILHGYDTSCLKALSVFEEQLVRNPSTFSTTKAALDFGFVLPEEQLQTGAPWELDLQIRQAQKLFITPAIRICSQQKVSTKEWEQRSSEYKHCSDFLLSVMRASCHDWPPHLSNPLAAIYLPTKACLSLFQKGKKVNPILLADHLHLDPPDFSCSILEPFLAYSVAWQLVSAKEQGTRPNNGALNDLLLVSARLARKQQNYSLAENLLLYQQASSPSSCGGILNRKSPLPFAPSSSNGGPLYFALIQDVAANSGGNSHINQKTLHALREGAKLLHSSGKITEAFEVLNASVQAANSISTEGKKDNNASLNEQLSRSYLTMVRFLQQDVKSSAMQNINGDSIKLLLENLLQSVQTNQVLDGLPELPDNMSSSSVLGEWEPMIGQLLHKSVIACPDLAKAWASLGNWCYRWARKSIDGSSNGTIELTPEEIDQIVSLLPKRLLPEERDGVLQVIKSIHAMPEGDWEEMGLDAYTDRAEIRRIQLINVCPRLKKWHQLEPLLQLWGSIAQKTYSHYEAAAKAYFKFLQINGQNSSDQYEDDNVTATLRLLRLVVKYASELRDVLEKELAITPTAPWRCIIPQLFSRLSHPEEYVRQSISDLLCRVAQASPHLIVFPAVVGSLTLKTGTLRQDSGLLGACLSQPVTTGEQTSDNQEASVLPMEQLLGKEEVPEDASQLEEEEEDRQMSAIMRNCFTALVDTLGRQDATTIAEVKDLAHELRRITLLWDELWLGSLNLHHAELNRRIQTLEEEIIKVKDNTSLSKEEKAAIIKEKHSIFLRPTLFFLEQLQSISGQIPETPQEQFFQDTYGKLIQDTLDSIRSPSDPSCPQTSWNAFKKLHQALQQQTRLSLSMDRISPRLSSLHGSVIPMPGIQSAMVTIQSVQNCVSVLPTKTKPKKLAFFGSDGKKYTYLFKGLEDLHLDERIMQFLSIVNNMFVKHKRHGKVLYNARHYSVTPLGPRSGLIEWVDGAWPLFGLYKRWQQREATAQVLKGQSNSSPSAPPLLRPSEIFYNKLTPLLKEKDISNLDNRKEWPLSVLLQVLQELINETPKDLLAKELWCSCISSMEWWDVTQTYNHSTAVMSVIGYIIGLGDRHLDNVLVDFSTGEVVHIDYNVCFEKGKNLRVPEKVPFRMTPNIEAALGVTGVEGMFRISCEQVLRVLRQGRETLLTLLEAFVYDPLVDWTPGSEGGYTGAVYGGGQVDAREICQARQNMESEIVHSLLAVRLSEMKADWIANRDELLASFPKLSQLLELWGNEQAELLLAEGQLQDICQQRALLEEAATNPNHPLYTLPGRYEEFSVMNRLLIGAKEAVTEKMNECSKWQSLHLSALEKVCGSELAKWCRVVAQETRIADQLSVAPAVEFLQTAGQGQLVQQCEQAESDLGVVLSQLQLSLQTTAELLSTYATIVMNFPPEYKLRNRSCQWQRWLERLLENFALDTCQEVIGQFHSQYGLDSTDIVLVQAAVSLHYQIQNHISDANTKLMNVLERRHLEGLEDAMGPIKILEQARAAIAQFLVDNGMEGYTSLQCMAVNVVCGLNKRLLMMETAAAGAGDCLVDLTSWGGDWFLDEIYSTTHNIAQLLDLIGDQGTSRLAHQAVSASYNVFSALEDLSLNFQAIILPEAVRAVQSGEESLTQLKDRLDTLLQGLGMPVSQVMKEMETNIRNIVMEIEPVNETLLLNVQRLRTDFDELIKAEPDVTEMSSGQMLFMGFNGLFSKVESDMNSLLTMLDELSLAVSPSTRKVDLIREASALQPPIHLSSTRQILREMAFLRRLQAMQNFFCLVWNTVAVLNLQQIGEVTEDHLFKPIKLFIADYVRKQVLGLPSQAVGYALCLLLGNLGIDVSAEVELRDVGAENKVSLEELSKKALDLCMKRDGLQPAQLAQAGSLLTTLDAACKKEDLARRLEQSMVQHRSSLERLQLQLARMQWLHEDLLVVHGNIGPLQNLAPPTRAHVMSEMRKSVQSLVSLESSVASAEERYSSLSSSVEQRLKWAAGANPCLATTQEELEAAINNKTNAVTNLVQLSRELVNICNSILHFEALRTRTSEAISSDGIFLTLINKCQESCIVADSCENRVSPVEEQLLALKPLPEKGLHITQEWIASLSEKISQALSSSKDHLESRKLACFAANDILKSHVYTIRNLLSTHHKLMSELRNILKNLAKQEEMPGPVQSYLSSYRSFSEQISQLVCMLLNEEEELTPQRVAAVNQQLNPLEQATKDAYQGLLDMAKPLASTDKTLQSLQGGKREESVGGDTEGGVAEGPLLSLLRKRPQAEGRLSPAVPAGSPSHKGQKKALPNRDPKTGKVIQERNSYATGVWKKVKMKLDGRDPEPNKRFSIAEQVDFIISEATRAENLAVLYEGWTPWV